MSTINQVAHELGKGVSNTLYDNMSVRDKSSVLEDILGQICELAVEVDVLTGGVNIDVDFLLGVQGSYEIGIASGEIDPQNVEPPSILYEESLFPSIENARGIEVQEIEEEDIGEPTDNPDDEGHAA